MSDAQEALLADLRAMLEVVGERGLRLTDTGRLRVADVRAINARFAVPEELDREVGTHTYRLRREDEAARVHLLRLVAQAAGLLAVRRGTLYRTAGARAFLRLAPPEAARRLFVAWWWKGAWDLLPAIEGVPQLALLRDRGATASALVALGETAQPLEALGTRLRTALAPGAPASTVFVLSDEAWGYAAWHVCFTPLAAFGGSRDTHTIETMNGHSFEKLAAVTLTEQGLGLLRAALDERPSAPQRIRRGMRSPYPPPRAGFTDDAIAWMVEEERDRRLLREHPEYAEAIERGRERVGGVNPRAHLALHVAVEEQLANNEPPEVRATYERLLALGYDEHEVRHGIADALAREIWAAQREDRAVDNASYLARLASMPLDEEAARANERDDAEAALDLADDDLAPPDLPPARLAASDREKLRKLPRAAGVWEGDLGDMPVIVGSLGVPVCAVWIDGSDGTVRGLATKVDADPGDLVLAAFVDGALRPKAGRPSLPWRVRVHPEVASALRPALAEIGVVVEAAEELPLARGALDSLANFLRDPEPPRTPRERRRRRRR